MLSQFCICIIYFAVSVFTILSF